MIRTKEQDVTTGVISLGLLANRLELSLVESKDDVNMLRQWSKILNDTITFIEAPAKVNETRIQANISPRLITRAQFLEQIYTATPANNRRNLGELVKYLKLILTSIGSLADSKNLEARQKKLLSSFAESIVKESIKEAARFHQEPHFMKTFTSIPSARMASNEEIS